MPDQPTLTMPQALAAGVIPPPDAYTEDGQPLWQETTLAAFWHQTPAQLETALDALPDAVWDGSVYRIH